MNQCSATDMILAPCISNVCLFFWQPHGIVGTCFDMDCKMVDASLACSVQLCLQPRTYRSLANASAHALSLPNCMARPSWRSCCKRSWMYKSKKIDALKTHACATPCMCSSESRNKPLTTTREAVFAYSHRMYASSLCHFRRLSKDVDIRGARSSAWPALSRVQLDDVCRSLLWYLQDIWLTKYMQILHSARPT